ncbi:tetratricopeptide repeat protein [Litorimonas haliclonae]|uniref:tetratricopeptide repeat protein n=1 Tax=Litorimonas haliclonae TaxID=2081977 RepID=UPI0039F0D0D1
MVDFINEVEEELRKDDYNKLLKKYGPAIAAVIALIIAGTAFLEWRKSSDDRMARAASSSYVSASDLAADGQSERAVSSFVALSEKAPSGYAGLSLMRAAAVELEGGDSAKAVDLYDQAAEKFKLARHKDLAKLKAAYILSDQGAYADVQARLDPLAAKDAPYEFLARELAGFVAYQTGDMNTARQEFTYLESIPGVPPSIAERAGQFLTLVPAAEVGEALAPEPVTPNSGDDVSESGAALPPPNETETDALEPAEAAPEPTNQTESGDAP